jgi:predicted signal transduction protein with EAL and GGDEF domain
VLAQRVREAVASVTGGAVTTSIGWVTFPTHTDDPRTLLERTDLARQARPWRAASST